MYVWYFSCQLQLPGSQSWTQVPKRKSRKPADRVTWEKSAKSSPIHWRIYGPSISTLLRLHFLMVISIRAIPSWARLRYFSPYCRFHCQVREKMNSESLRGRLFLSSGASPFPKVLINSITNRALVTFNYRLCSQFRRRRPGTGSLVTVPIGGFVGKTFKVGKTPVNVKLGVEYSTPQWRQMLLVRKLRFDCKLHLSSQAWLKTLFLGNRWNVPLRQSVTRIVKIGN